MPADSTPQISPLLYRKFVSMLKKGSRSLISLGLIPVSFPWHARSRDESSTRAVVPILSIEEAVEFSTSQHVKTDASRINQRNRECRSDRISSANMLTDYPYSSSKRVLRKEERMASKPLCKEQGTEQNDGLVVRRDTTRITYRYTLDERKVSLAVTPDPGMTTARDDVVSASSGTAKVGRRPQSASFPMGDFLTRAELYVGKPSAKKIDLNANKLKAAATVFLQPTGLSTHYALERTGMSKKASESFLNIDNFCYWPVYTSAAVAASEIILSVEYCCDCENHITTTRHDPEKYYEVALRTKSELENALDNCGSLVRGRPHTVILLPIRHTIAWSSPPRRKGQYVKSPVYDRMSQYNDESSSRRMSSASRVGALEIQIVTRGQGSSELRHILHSKLHSGEWPKRSHVMRRLRQVLVEAFAPDFSSQMTQRQGEKAKEAPCLQLPSHNRVLSHPEQQAMVELFATPEATLSKIRIRSHDSYCDNDDVAVDADDGGGYGDDEFEPLALSDSDGTMEMGSLLKDELMSLMMSDGPEDITTRSLDSEGSFNRRLENFARQK